jgi:hypothetical protein
MTAKYKTPGKKEFKKINYLKEKLLDSDPFIRKQALFIYNQVISTQYDKEIEDIEKQIYQKEKTLRLSDKKREKDKLLNSLKHKSEYQENEEEEEEEIKIDSSDTYVNSELTALKFKLKYLNQLKDIEIDTKIDKTRVLIK